MIAGVQIRHLPTELTLRRNKNADGIS